jgi:hypothetical protein
MENHHSGLMSAACRAALDFENSLREFPEEDAVVAADVHHLEDQPLVTLKSG